MDKTQQYIYQKLVVTTLCILGFGTVFYHYVEKWNWIDAYYFCVVSLATVGYGDFVPTTQLGRLFTTVYVLAGIGILGAFVNAFVKHRGDKLRVKAEDRLEDKRKR